MDECVGSSEELDIPLPVRSSWTLPEWVRLTLGPDTGLLATPTATANQSCPSMQKWPCCRRLTRALGSLTPRKYAWMMGWPTPTSSLLPMAMGRSPSARRSRGSSSAVPEPTDPVQGAGKPVRLSVGGSHWLACPYFSREAAKGNGFADCNCDESYTGGRAQGSPQGPDTQGAG
jgi:hypothetical protein